MKTELVERLKAALEGKSGDEEVELAVDGEDASKEAAEVATKEGEEAASKEADGGAIQEG